MVKRLTEYLVVRFIISGGTSAVVNLSVFYTLNSILGVHYIISSIAAFIVAFFVSFTLHKYWTFKNKDTDRTRQMAMYLGTSLFGLGLNTLLIYLFVDKLHIIPFLSQVFAGVCVAFSSFTLSHKFVFKYKGEEINVEIQ